MNRLNRLALLSILLFAYAGIASATTYYIAANGSDTNNGTTKTTPWQHAPGMPNCKGACASASPQPGDSIIFRGGDTWHFGNSNLTPYVGGKAWTFSYNGSNGNPIYIGVDQTWYTGSSWARPILSGDDQITNSTVSSCAYDYNNINVVLLGTDNHIRLDNFEMSGFCYSGTSGVNAGFVNFGGTDAIVENMYFHGMTIETTLTDDEQVAIHGSGNGFKADLTNQCIYNVFDNSDGSLGNSGTYPNGKASMEAIQNACAVVAYSVFNRVSNGLVSSTSIVHDNLFHDMYEPQGSVHGNIWNVNNDGLVPLGAQEFYNNVMYNINEGVGVWFEQNPVGYYFNNVSWNISNSVNCLRVGGSNVNTMQPVTTMYIYNNTWDAPCTVRGTAPTPGGDPAQNGPVYFQNNHLIGYGITSFSSGTGVLYSCDAGATCTWTDNGNELFQTEAVANAQGYTPANEYAPASGGATIGAGANLSSLCSKFSSDSELCGGTSDGVSEQGNYGGEIASDPAIPMIPRQTSWDIGAYKFNNGSGGPPSPPTGLAAVVQ
jgi:hypothetical protein